MAVLVRNRRHLAEVVTELQREDAPGGRIPYKATDIEPLNERQEILDLLALTRAPDPQERQQLASFIKGGDSGQRLVDLCQLLFTLNEFAYVD